MRIAVMGTGGTGGYFGGLLARSGEEVTFIARGAQLDAIENNGLTIKSKLCGNFRIPVHATAEPGQIGPVELVLFCVKAYDNHAAAHQIRPVIGPETVVMSVQNGIDNAQQIGSIVGHQHLVGAVAYVFSTLEAPGIVAQTAGPGKIVFGELQGGTSRRTEKILHVLRKAGIAAELDPRIQNALWQKYIANCGINGITALTRLPLGAILACAETRRFLRATMEEVEAVAQADHADLPQGCVDQSMAFLNSLGSSARGSMYYDLHAGRRLELEVLNGTVVRLGTAHGISTPFNFSIYAALKPYLNGAPSTE